MGYHGAIWASTGTEQERPRFGSRSERRRRRLFLYRPLSLTKGYEADLALVLAGSGDLSVKAANSLDYPDRLEPMTETPQSRAARLAHLRRTGLRRAIPSRCH